MYIEFININETLEHVLRENIAATSLKISCKNLHSVTKGNAETNMKVFALSLWKNFSWGLTYIDEFIKQTSARLSFLFS